MPFIMPSGNKSFNWSPKSKDGKLTKTASSNKGEVQEVQGEQDDKDIMYNLAKQVVEARNVEAQDYQKEEEEGVADTEACGTKVADEHSEGGEKPEKKANVFTNEVSEEETGEEVSEEACCDEEVVDALDNLEEAVEEVKDAVKDTHEEDEEEFVVLEEDEGDEVVDEGEVTFEVSVEDDNTEEEEDLYVKSEDEEKDQNTVQAASNDDFVKLSHISPETRKKTAEFWKNELGYPSDYVDLMVKNYK